MARSYLLISCILVLLACSKKNDAPAPPTIFVPSAADTLTTGWTKVGDISPAETVSDIHFTNSTDGYATTDAGVYKTSDAGSTWSKINSDYGFVNVAANGNNALFINQTKFTYNTQDRGLNIQKTAYDTFAGIGFQEAFYSSPNTVYMVSVVYLWKSTNGGASFIPFYNFRTGDGGCNLFFVNDQLGWASRDRKLYKTENGGVDWIINDSLTNRVGPVFFLNTEIGFYCDNEKVYKTQNSGLSWVNTHSFPPSHMITDIHFINALTGYCCAGTKIYKTTDGGNSWSIVVALGEKEISEVFFLNGNTGWACGKYGYVLRFQL